MVFRYSWFRRKKNEFYDFFVNLQLVRDNSIQDIMKKKKC